MGILPMHTAWKAVPQNTKGSGQQSPTGALVNRQPP
jgi:hypothetical protein